MTGLPMAALGVAGYGALAARNKHLLAQAKEAALQDAMRKQDAILRELNDKVALSEERSECLVSHNIILRTIITDLRSDLGK